MGTKKMTLTNKLSFDTDFASLNEAYNFLRFTWQQADKNDKSKSKQWANSHHLDKLLTDERAEACLYRYGKYAYAMFSKQNTADIETIRQRLSSDPLYENIQVDIVYAAANYTNKSYGENVEIPEVWLYQLLFNALANSTSKNLHFHNLNGSLIYVPLLNPKRNSKKIIAHQITINNAMILNANAVTFQSKGAIFHAETDERQRQKKLNRPAYKLGLHSLKRIYKHKDNWDVFIRAGIPGTKASSDALSIADYPSFESSRMGILHQLLRRFNARYKSMVTASWVSLAVDESLRDRLYILYNDRQFINLLKTKRVRLVDKIQSEESWPLVLDMQTQLAEMGIESSIGTRESKDALHICLIKPKQAYEEINDPYSTDENRIKQHITDDNYQNCKDKDNATIQKVNSQSQKNQRKLVLQNLLKELLIKEDVINKTVTLFNSFDTKERQLYLEGTWVFGTVEENGCHLLEVKETGELRYIFHDFCLLFNDHPYTDAVEHVQSAINGHAYRQRRTIEAFVISSAGDVNIILDYEQCVLPNLSLIEEEIRQKDKALPQHLKNPNELIALIEDCQIASDECWHAFITELHQTDVVDKSTLRQLINKHFHTSSKQNQLIRNKLYENGVTLSVSKSKDKLFELMPDLFSVQAGQIDEANAWYSVGYYTQSLKQSLPHMIRIKQLKALKGDVLHQKILPLLDVDFVGYKAPTVLPYPLKYLREMSAINKH